MGVEGRLTESEEKVMAVKEEVVVAEKKLEELGEASVAQSSEMSVLEIRLAANLNETSNQADKLMAPRVSDIEAKTSGQDVSLSALESRLDATESHVEELKLNQTMDVVALTSRVIATENVNAAQLHDLATLGVRLTATEYATSIQATELLALGDRLVAAEVVTEGLKDQHSAQSDKIAALEDGLQATWQLVGELETQTSALSTELSTVDSKLSEVKKDVDQLEQGSGGVVSVPKVAFSAAMLKVSNLRGGKHGAHMVYNSVQTNVGDGYNPKTGVFTAPVTGVYFFRFTASNRNHLDLDMGVKLYKNQEEIMYNHENGVEDFFSNAVTLELVMGDKVFLMLPPWVTVYADSHENTFSGHLLFTM